MIDRLIAALRGPAGTLPPEMIAEALWFAQFLPATPVPPAATESTDTDTGTGGRPLSAGRPADLPPPEPLPGIDEPGAAQRSVVAQMYPTDGGGRRDGATMAAGSPAVHALPHSRAIGQSLTPLRHAVENQREPQFDEKATVEQAAETGLLELRFAPGQDRWLDLAVVVDQSPSMVVWTATINELIDLARRHTAFGSVRVWRIRSDRNGGTPVLSTGGSDAPRDPRELIDPARRGLILFVSDCIAPMWDSATLKHWLAIWGRSGPVAVIQPLPQRLWHRCRPLMYHVSLYPPYPGASVAQMNPRPRDDSFTIPDDAVAIPVLELTAPWLATGVSLVAGNAGGRVDAVALLTRDPPEVYEDGDDFDLATDLDEESTPVDRVKLFLEWASANARHLAEFLAAAPLTLPVMRLVQQLMLPGSLPRDLAEVFLSGLLYRVTPEEPPVPPERVLYDFTDGVRQVLLAGLRAGEALTILDEVSQFVNRRLGTSFDFPALLAGQMTQVPATEYGQPFAAVTREVLTALGGRYAALAERLQPPPEAESEHEDDAEATLPAHRRTGRDKGDDVTQQIDNSMEPTLGTSRPAIWGDVPPRNPDFTGREELLRNLRRQLANRVTALLPHTLHGLGGVGKTQLAVEYAYRYESVYDLVWWVPAEQTALLRQSLTALARRLDLVRPGEEDASQAIASVYDTLRTGQRYPRWLLVFDNAKQPEDLAPFLSNPGGHVLVTSRNDNWNGVAQSLEVDVFDRPESIQLLGRRLSGISTTDADRVAHLLGDLPLALEQAANWIAATAMPVAEYTELLEKRTVDAMREGTPSTYDVPVAVALGLSVERLAEENIPALQLLELCAFFGAEPISIRLLPSGRYARNLPEILGQTVRDDIDLRRAVRDIGRFGLAKVDAARNSIQVHRLVQAVLRDRLTDEQRTTYRVSVQEILEAYNPGDPTDDPTTWSRHAEIGPHIDASGALYSDNAAIRTVVLDQIRYLYVSGDYASSRELAEAAHNLWTEKLGEEHRLTIVTARFLANAMRTTGAAEDARRLNERTLVIARRALGEDHEHTLAIANSVGGDLRLAGEWDRSRELDEELLERHQRVFGDDDPNTLRVANNLGVDLRLLGDFARAYELDTNTWTRRRRLLGDNHPDTLFSVVTGVSRDLYGLGRYDEAIAEQRKWLPILRSQLGPDHANVLLGTRIHAATLRKAGLSHEASEVATEVVRRRRERYGENHAETISAMLTLFTILVRTDQVAEAKRLGEETLSRYRRNIGPEHVFTYLCMTDLAIVLRQSGDYGRARELDEIALRNMTHNRTLGPEHPYTICTAVNMSNNMALSRNHRAAVDLLSDTLPRARAVLGEDHPEALACAVNLALDLRAVGSTDQARTLQEDTLARLRRALSNDEHPDIMDTLHGRRLYCVVDPPPT
jgi:tetratricopeptide (TPR) repeat protein